MLNILFHSLQIINIIIKELTPVWLFKITKAQAN